MKMTCCNIVFLCPLYFKISPKQVKSALPHPVEEPLHNIKPGDYVVVKNLRRKSWKTKGREGPFQVLLTTHTAVKVAERATWVHAAHCRRVGPGLQGVNQREDG